MFIEIGGKINNIFTRNIIISSNEINKYRQSFNNTDYYSTVFAYDNEDYDKANIIGDFYLDIDNKNFLNNKEDFLKTKRDALFCINTLNYIYGIPTEIIKIYFSGNKGFHIIVPKEIFNIKAHQNLHLVFNELGKNIKEHTLFKSVDLRYDKRRLFRVENSINSKSGLYKIPLSLKEFNDCSLNNIFELAKQPKNIEYKKPYPIDKAITKFNNIKDIALTPKQYNTHNNFIITKTLPCVKNVLDTGANDGNRNNTSVALASCLLQNGKEYDEVLDILIEWNREKNMPSLTDKEIENTVRSAYKELNRGIRYGCSTMKDYGYCIPEKCGVYN